MTLLALGAPRLDTDHFQGIYHFLIRANLRSKSVRRRTFWACPSLVSFSGKSDPAHLSRRFPLARCSLGSADLGGAKLSGHFIPAR